jgi:hypothetical protein
MLAAFSLPGAHRHRLLIRPRTGCSPMTSPFFTIAAAAGALTFFLEGKARGRG